MQKIKCLPAIVIIMSMLACSDTSNTENSVLDEFYESNFETQQFTLNPKGDTTVVSENGTSIYIPKPQFKDPENNFTFSFQEYFKKSDLIFNNLPTNTRDDQWLVTGGSFFMKFEDTAGNKVLFDEQLILNFPIQDQIPEPSEMEVWSGTSESGPFSWTSDAIEAFKGWSNISSASQGSNRVEVDSLENFTMHTVGFQWINCDYVFDSPAEKINVEVEIANTDLDLDNVDVFMVLKNINSVLGLNRVWNKRFESFEVPIDEEAYIVAIGENDGLFLKIEEFTISKNQKIELTLEPVERDELLAAVRALD